MKRLFVLSITLAIFQPFLTARLHAQESSAPSLITYQGKLTQADGVTPHADGNHAVTFRLFDALNGGTLIWGATYTVPVVQGVFSIALGSPGGIPLDGTAVNDLRFAFSGAERYLEITVGGLTLLPRQQMSSVPYAVKALHGVPPGTVVAFFGTTPPPGWLMCDGAPYNREGIHKALYLAIGTSCGAPDAGKFRVPDLRGRFLRGADDPDGSGGSAFTAANIDPDSAQRTAMAAGGNTGSPQSQSSVGSIQQDQVGEHTHGGDAGSLNGDLTARIYISDDGGNVWAQERVVPGWTPTGPGANATPVTWPAGTVTQAGTMVVGRTSANNPSTTEARPKNASANFIIKY